METQQDSEARAAEHQRQTDERRTEIDGVLGRLHAVEAKVVRLEGQLHRISNAVN